MTEASLATVSPYDSWQAMREKAATLVRSGFLPKAVNTAEKAIALMQAGQELGLQPMQSIRGINIVDGRPTLGAELMAALVYQRVPGALLRVVETNDTRCIVEAARPGQEPTRFTFTMQDARTAGLVGKQNWRTYPRAMLRSRCVSEACRSVFPDATMGCYTPEELEPINARPVSAALMHADADHEYEEQYDHQPAPEPRKLASAAPQTQSEPAAPAEPFRFASGEHKGELITEVPDSYLARLASHKLAAKMRRVVDDELDRREALALREPPPDALDAPAMDVSTADPMGLASDAHDENGEPT